MWTAGMPPSACSPETGSTCDLKTGCISGEERLPVFLPSAGPSRVRQDNRIHRTLQADHLSPPGPCPKA
jgi:hypothetical protein